MSVQFEIDMRNFQRAASTYAERKTKSDADVVNKAMRYWLPFAAARVKAKTPGSHKIRQELMKTAAGVSRGRKKRQHQLANTLAASIVARRLKKKGAVLPSRKDADKKDLERIGEFYDRVARLVNRRIASAHYLRAGFIPAFRQFKVPRLPTAGHTHFKGRSEGKLAIPSLSKTSEAFARNAREGAVEITPNAFRDSLPEVTRQFLKWLEQDTVEQGRKSGFY